MAKSKVPVTYAFGRRDRVDPKFAPFGVLKVGKNLRVRKDGRLGVRHGYQPLTMTTRNGTLVANDLFEFQGRLCALGSDAGDGYPTDTFEYLGLSSERWRGTDPTGERVTLNPFTNAREVAGVPQPNGGVLIMDAAGGGGYVCHVYRIDTNVYATIVDASDDQVIHHEDLTSVAAGVTHIRVAFSIHSFFVALAASDNSITIYSYRPGTSTAFAEFAEAVAASANSTTALDLVPVTNPTDTIVAVASDRGSGTDLQIKLYDAAGDQVGSTIAVSSIYGAQISLDADEADDTINLYTVETATDGRLRTFDFAGNLLNGPKTVTSGTIGSICRLPAQSGFNAHVAVAVRNTDGVDTVIQFWDMDAHTLTSTVTVSQALLRTRLVSGQSANQDIAVVFGALVGPDASRSNALFFVTPNVAHLSTRDYLRAESVTEITNLSLDSSTGKITWLTAHDPGISGQAIPTVTLLDFQSDERRQTAKYGGLVYTAGATPSAYDGRVSVEAGFAEVPEIKSITDGLGGSLTSGATYTYQWHWQYVFADGSLLPGPPSLPVSNLMGGSNNRNVLSVTTPHAIGVALGDALYGASLIGALYRNVWNSTTSTAGSTMRLVQTITIPAGMANYGALLELTDDLSDATLASEAPIYTQAERGPFSGPLEHNAPRACSYITATEARLITGGLAKPYHVQISKAAFLGESFTFSEFSSFFQTVSGAVLGVHRLDQARLVFTSNGLFALPGEGPDDLGGNALGSPVELATPSGLQDWRSFLEDPHGLWFQLDDTKLFHIPRGGGSPTWEGVDIEDTLLSFPVITGAGKHKGDNAAVFACENAASTSARIVVNDFRTRSWFEDTPVLQTDQGIEALCSFGETIAYISGGVVYVQSKSSFADGSSTFIEHQWRTHPLYPFGLGGYGNIYEILATGEYRGDCVLTLRYSFDDGVTFSTHPATFTLSSLTAGQTIQRKWTLPQDIASSIVVEITVTAVVATATEGFILNQCDLLVEAEDGLRELSADETG